MPYESDRPWPPYCIKDFFKDGLDHSKPRYGELYSKGLDGGDGYIGDENWVLTEQSVPRGLATNKVGSTS